MHSTSCISLFKQTFNLINKSINPVYKQLDLVLKSTYFFHKHHLFRQTDHKKSKKNNRCSVGNIT